MIRQIATVVSFILFESFFMGTALVYLYYGEGFYIYFWVNFLLCSLSKLLAMLMIGVYVGGHLLQVHSQ